ncbi:adenylyl-sulfate kinase [Sediminibacterium ginsengisoli]|uniref:Adenylyl-sulfate kinase n=1 Tax=Sediminibacterium ginsengisoli TaxID=413434 RepID=A0A1T4L5Y1_9BACT|nr:adenylyl-sulfate kinase [Sediminibacterium ginsengisoli]SJZ49951.1 adenylylsulfate kinase [Sediminibacterium ginsengisoli]
MSKEKNSYLFTQHLSVTRQNRETHKGNKAFTLWFTGLSGAGKSTIASLLDKWLFDNGYHSYVLDGDNTRLGINSDLGFSKEDRTENIRRVAEMCRLFNDAGIITIASFISPFENDREKASAIIGKDSFYELFIDSPLETCRKRDTKGLYLLAEQGKITDFTGISSPYEKPEKPDLHLHTAEKSPEDSLIELITWLRQSSKLLK